jgi:hypothetical protein
MISAYYSQMVVLIVELQKATEREFGAWGCNYATLSLENLNVKT